VRLREIQHAVLRVARLEVRRLREVREFALGWRASVSLLEPRRADAQVLGDRFAAGGEQAHHVAADAFNLEAVAVVAGGPFQAEPLSEGSSRCWETIAAKQKTKRISYRCIDGG
jgi:hypothetical protein